jgi:cytochrome c oxidase assembly protein subunit 15
LTLPATSGALHRFAQFHVFATFCLLAFGASVTSNDAGLAVPDWPTTYGEINPIAPYLRGLVRGLIALEHNHRVFGMVVGLLTIVEFGWILRTVRAPRLRRLAWVLMVGVVVQGSLGGATVLGSLPAAVSIAHGMVAQGFFCLSIATAWRLSAEWRDAEPQVARGAPTPAALSLARAALLVAVAVACQLFLGALVRHTVAKTRVPEFTDLPVVLHMAFAVVVLAAIGTFVARVSVAAAVDARVRRAALLQGGLVAAQLALGLLSVATRTDPLITVLHVITGAALLGTAVLAVLRSRRLAERAAP